MWGDTSWGPRLEDLLANAAYTLLANPGQTLADLPTLLTNADSRVPRINSADSTPRMNTAGTFMIPVAPVADTACVEERSRRGQNLGRTLLAPRRRAGSDRPVGPAIGLFLRCRHPVML